MRPKQHGSTAAPVQATLRWDVDREVADNICSFNREGAEPSLSFTNYQAFTKQLGWQRGVDMAAVEPTVYYDSVSGAPLFVAPRGRTVDDFLGESLRHGWPSFRQEEVVWEHVRVLDGSEVVSATGTHLGHLMPDEKGARFCINLCSIAGQPAAAAEEGGASGSLKAAWPLLHELAAVGPWQGRMHYASGAEGMTPAPFVLEGTFHVAIDGGRCRVTSSVVLPGGVERVVSMAGESWYREQRERASAIISKYFRVRRPILRKVAHFWNTPILWMPCSSLPTSKRTQRIVSFVFFSRRASRQRAQHVPQVRAA